MAPLWVRTGTFGPHWIALEIALLVAVFLVLPRRWWARGAAWVAAGAILATTLLLIADSAARMSLARPLNLYLDARLVGSVQNLLDGTFGSGWGPVILIGGVLAAVGLVVVLARLLAGLTETRDGWRPRVPALVVLVLLASLVPLRWAHPRGVVLGLPVTQLAREQTKYLGSMLQERDRFAAEVAATRTDWSTEPGLLVELDQRDVVLAFIESYGTSAVEDPRYAPVVTPTLEELERVAADRELHVATGRMVAPSQGGMSWLGHGSAISGLWLDNQLRYELMLGSDQPTLVDDFEEAGYRTVALMPQITMAWPEGRLLGYDEIWTRPEIDYRGPPLNWVTMPDQFTWSYMQRNALDDPTDAPVFVEAGMISSHAPWTPILELEPWAEIGDGSIFERWRDAGESPESLWRDGERVRAAYAESVRYALETMVSWVERYLDDDVVLVALGDHQPAPLVTGDGAPRTVPVHIISTDAELVERFVSRGFVAGAFPPAASPDGSEPRMSELRSILVGALSSPARGTTQ
ncbi:MAG TPA: hypothetical protein VJ925_09390 [Longimicrobiales bacterium]|nr:hypothetical protein [Longimicrobiales bacterium]